MFIVVIYKYYTGIEQDPCDSENDLVCQKCKDGYYDIDCKSKTKHCFFIPLNVSFMLVFLSVFVLLFDLLSITEILPIIQ